MILQILKLKLTFGKSGLLIGPDEGDEGKEEVGLWNELNEDDGCENDDDPNDCCWPKEDEPGLNTGDGRRKDDDDGDENDGRKAEDADDPNELTVGENVGLAEPKLLWPPKLEPPKPE